MHSLLSSLQLGVDTSNLVLALFFMALIFFALWWLWAEREEGKNNGLTSEDRLALSRDFDRSIAHLLTAIHKAARVNGHPRSAGHDDSYGTSFLFFWVNKISQEAERNRVGSLKLKFRYESEEGNPTVVLYLDVVKRDIYKPRKVTRKYRMTMRINLSRLNEGMAKIADNFVLEGVKE